MAKDATLRGRESADPAESRRWLERARRILPNDDIVGLSLALACLNGGDPATARALFAPIAERWDLLEAWLRLSASAAQAGDPGVLDRAD